MTTGVGLALLPSSVAIAASGLAPFLATPSMAGLGIRPAVGRIPKPVHLDH